MDLGNFPPVALSTLIESLESSDDGDTDCEEGKLNFMQQIFGDRCACEGQGSEGGGSNGKDSSFGQSQPKQPQPVSGYSSKDQNKDGKGNEGQDSPPGQSHPEQPQPALSQQLDGRGQLKRKLDVVEFEVVGSEWHEKDEFEKSCADKEKVNDHLEKASQFNSVSFFMQVKIVLGKLHSTLDGPCPKDKEEVQDFQKHIRQGVSKVEKLAQMPGAAFFPQSREVFVFLRESIIEKIDNYTHIVSPNLRDWCHQIDKELEDFDSFDQEDKGHFFRAIGEEMEDYLCQIDFCLETIDGFIIPNV